jgi:ABC-2 type transport system ATP-binding protein
MVQAAQAAVSTAPATSAAGAPVLACRDVRVRFENVLAVRDVSFELGAGTLLGLIGPNGAGKTTLLRSLAGLQPITRGTVEVLGRPVDTELGLVGFTPDVPPMYDDLTVRQFLTFVGKGYDLPAHETRERLEFWLEKVWLSEKADQRVKKLSRGMKQRLGIARTLLPNPAVILLDEPAAGLDPAGRVQFRQLLVDLRDQGKCLIVSSHILADMSEYCSHIGIMSAGQMVKFGTVREIAEHHDAGRCRYVVTLAHPVSGAREALASVEDLAVLSVERERLEFEYLSDRDAAASLLRALIERRLPVASFTPMTANLEEAYLRTGIRQVD